MARSYMLRVCSATVGVLVSGALAHGAMQLLQFEPMPVSPAAPEFMFTGNPSGALTTGTGSTGGLEIDTPVSVSGVPDSSTTTVGGLTETTFDGVSLTVTGLTSSGASITVGSLEVVQPLTSGTFDFYSATVRGGDELLLSGTFNNALLNASLTSTAASFESNVTYTGGLILAALPGSPQTLSGGSVSVALTSLDGIETASLAAFGANGTGTFDAIPEPASLAMLAGGVLGLSRRRR